MPAPHLKLSLFSGIGGDDLASDWAGIQTVAFCEKDKYCQKVLAKHWPGIPIIEDVKDVTREKVMAYAALWQDDGRERGDVATPATGREGVHAAADVGGEVMGNPERCGLPREPRRGSRTFSQDGYVGDSAWSGAAIDIISGGFPCQPHSVAGKRKGAGDERNLWPEVRRILSEIKPRWFVGENVPGLFSSNGGDFFSGVLADLAALGYVTGWCCYGAVDVGALHRRDRVFIVAHAKHIGQPTSEITGSVGTGSYDCTTGQDTAGQPAGLCRTESMADTNTDGLQNRIWRNRSGIATAERTKRETPEGRSLSWWAVEPNVGRVANGVPHRVDRLRALGNAVVPQQIYPIYKAIAEIENA
jgi:DNA (cytosine-5)-methyltransferase 1